MGTESFDLKCRACGAPLSKDNLLVELSMARCTQCGAVSGVKGVQDWSRAPVVMPTGFRLEEEGDAVVITYDGGGLKKGPLGVMIFFITAILFAYSAGFGHFAKGFTVWEWIYIGTLPTFGVIFALLDVLGILHRVRVRVSRDGVAVKGGGPVPFTEKFVSASTIVQVFTREFKGEEVGVRYEVIARCRDGKLAYLVGNLHEAPQALYFEQRIEKALGIKDVPVLGEIPRSGSK